MKRRKREKRDIQQVNVATAGAGEDILDALNDGGADAKPVLQGSDAEIGVKAAGEDVLGARTDGGQSAQGAGGARPVLQGIDAGTGAEAEKPDLLERAKAVFLRGNWRADKRFWFCALFLLFLYLYAGGQTLPGDQALRAALVRQGDSLRGWAAEYWRLVGGSVLPQALVLLVAQSGRLFTIVNAAASAFLVMLATYYATVGGPDDYHRWRYTPRQLWALWLVTAGYLLAIPYAVRAQSDFGRLAGAPYLWCLTAALYALRPLWQRRFAPAQPLCRAARVTVWGAAALAALHEQAGLVLLCGLAVELALLYKNSGQGPGRERTGSNAAAGAAGHRKKAPSTGAAGLKSGRRAGAARGTAGKSAGHRPDRREVLVLAAGALLAAGWVACLCAPGYGVRAHSEAMTAGAYRLGQTAAESLFWAMTACAQAALDWYGPLLLAGSLLTAVEVFRRQAGRFYRVVAVLPCVYFAVWLLLTRLFPAHDAPYGVMARFFSLLPGTTPQVSYSAWQWFSTLLALVICLLPGLLSLCWLDDARAAAWGGGQLTALAAMVLSCLLTGERAVPPAAGLAAGVLLLTACAGALYRVCRQRTAGAAETAEEHDQENVSTGET